MPELYTFSSLKDIAQYCDLRARETLAKRNALEKTRPRSTQVKELTAELGVWWHIRDMLMKSRLVNSNTEEPK